METNSVIVRATSHRGRDRLFSALGREPHGLYRFNPPVSDAFEITQDEAQKLRAIEKRKGWGFTRLRREELSKCWS